MEVKMRINNVLLMMRVRTININHVYIYSCSQYTARVFRAAAQFTKYVLKFVEMLACPYDT